MERSYRAYLREYRSDIPASLVVFLVALPLCLGIALASGAPLFAGLITGIVGGIVVGFLSGSHTSVSGPAAGLAVIVLAAITELGSYELFLTAVVLSGVIQLVMGFAKAGIIGLYFPSSVIKGMLAAIGLLLILKQLPYFFGVTAEFFGDDSFIDDAGGNTFTELLYSMSHIGWGSFIIGAIGLAIMILWEAPFFKKRPAFRLLPGALMAVVLGVLINAFFIRFYPSLAIEAKQLVIIPNLSDPEVFATAFAFPDVSGLLSPVVWRIAFVIALIASLETLLSIEAVDKLDPHKRHTPKNRELKAQGAGNLISGLIGGIPMTAVIVRSSANIDSGSRTKMSAIYHGILLLVCVLAIPGILNLIPLSALAAVLLMVGYKLSKPSLYRLQFSLGWNQFLPFIITIIAILLTDLLIGIFIGLGVGIFFILRANYKTPYFYHAEEGHSGPDGRKKIRLILSEHVSFLNKASLLLTLDELPENSEVTIDGTLCQEIDHDALAIIRDFVIGAPERDIKVRLKRVPISLAGKGIALGETHIEFLEDEDEDDEINSKLETSAINNNNNN
jgi:MFS superfamily sulfate permease-like transporter